MEQWWWRKLDKARECDLQNITAEEIGMLELIRGIVNQALCREFLKQRDPTLDGLLQIAKNWQRATVVNKNMESTVDSRKTSSSNYKKGKTNDWKEKAENANKSSVKNPEKSNDKNPNDKSGGKMKCNRCRNPRCRSIHFGKPCWATDKTCDGCGKKGHVKPACPVSYTHLTLPTICSV